jgi:hypothetical protein
VRTLRILPDAEEELTEAAAWYERKRTGMGVELIAMVDRALEQILDAPIACALWREGRPYGDRDIGSSGSRASSRGDRNPSCIPRPAFRGDRWPSRTRQREQSPEVL